MNSLSDMVKSVYRRLLPVGLRGRISRLLSVARGVVAAVHDGRRLGRHIGTSDAGGIMAEITARYHMIEKGLSFDSPKKAFGRAGIDRLMQRLVYAREQGIAANAVECGAALHALRNYRDHCKLNVESAQDRAWISKLDTFLGDCEQRPDSGLCNSTDGGVWEMTGAAIQFAAQGPFPELVQSRHSIRHFSPGDIDRSHVERAIGLAQRSPSVCNRQSTRLYLVTDAAKIAEVLRLHGGARGFEQQMGLLVVVASDVSAFLSMNERHQPWFDTGVYGMTLMLAFHHLGYGTCPLHWCVDRKKDAALRKIIGAQESHVIAALIAVGHLPDKFRVAKSQRLPMSRVVAREI